jgi:hypothetical protein
MAAVHEERIGREAVANFPACATALESDAHDLSFRISSRTSPSE